ncbi:MAG TPA: hypothetical protein DDW86_06310 [Clostridiales bacterium]|nr:hypothetical protein [Clostridiales bacterium]
MKMKPLKIDITNIRREIAAEQNFDRKWIPEDMIWQGEPLRFRDPLHVKGRIFNGGDVLLLTADVKGNIILQCGACLESYVQGFDFPIEARLKSAPNKENPDYFVYKGNEVDLSEIVLEFLLSELPIRRRCREDCKGLCPVCGANRNDGECSCTITGKTDPELTVDERLKPLRDYFFNQ